MAGVEGRQTGAARGLPVALLDLGLLGLCLLPLCLLEYAVEVVPGPGSSTLSDRVWRRWNIALGPGQAERTTYRHRGDAEPWGQYGRRGREFADTPCLARRLT